MTKLPETRYNYVIDSILDQRRLLREDLFKGFGDHIVSVDMFEIIVEEFAERLSSRINPACLFDSLAPLAGQKLTKEKLDEFCWRICGNQSRLRFHAVLPWCRQTELEWAPAQISSAKPYRTKRDVSGYVMEFQLLAGTACPRVIQQFWSDRLCRFAAKRLGFTRKFADARKPLPNYLYHHPTELVTLRINLLLDPRVRGDGPTFSRIDCTGSMVDWNREQLRFRERRDEKHACPFKFPDAQQCFRCPKGFRSCRAGCHRFDYVFQACSRCEKPRVAFNLDWSKTMCIACFMSQALAMKSK